ncbi:MAG TPA: hypothetical protein VE267_11585, partial [Bradyrhizobium sp.]|nr:hypothetical protein [Bradyrhizobium sp.]
ASTASNRVRNPATWFIALRAKIKATIAITMVKKLNGESNIKPPAGRAKPLTGHISDRSQSNECSFAR